MSMGSIPCAATAARCSSLLAQVQDAAVDLGMQRFHPAIQHLREAGEVGNIAYREPGLAQGPRRTSGRNQFHVHAGQLAGEIDQASLIRNTQKGPLNLLIFHSKPALIAICKSLQCLRTIDEMKWTGSTTDRPFVRDSRSG